MTSIDELRRTLETHATDVGESDVVTRTAAVHHRVAVVRRRRRAAVAGGAAAVLAVAAGVARLPESEGPDPANRTVVGVEAPAQMRSLDYTYAFDRAIEGDGVTAVVKLEASDEPRLVSWATEGDNDDVRVNQRGYEPLTIGQADFTDFVLVHPGEPDRVAVTAVEGEVGLAVYELTDAAPEGVTDDGITFREQVENRTLVDAEVGELGDSDISLPVSMPSGGVGFATFCVGGPEDARFRVGVGKEHVELSCDDASTFDPGLNSFELTRSPAGDDPVRAWVVDRAGRAIDDPDLRLGVGVYRVTPDQRRVADQPVPELIEEDGHRWRLDAVHESDRPTVTARTSEHGPQLVSLLVPGDVVEALVDIEGRPTSTDANHTGGPVGFGLGQVSAGSRISVSLSGTTEGFETALVTYERDD